jgi:hypothetical protein
MSIAMDTTILDRVKAEFEKRAGLSGLPTEVITRSDGSILVLKVANPTERLFRVLEDAKRTIAVDDATQTRITLEKASKPDILNSPEGRLFVRTLAESLNVNRNTFRDDFFSRYTKSVFGAEAQITAASNHIVFGRRGAGKSSLLLYALHLRERDDAVSVWIDMQTYSRRGDNKVIASVLEEILRQVEPTGSLGSGAIVLSRLRDMSLGREDVDEKSLRELLPEVRRALAPAATRQGGVAVFLDDFHVLEQTLQPRLLDHLYAVARGNNVYLKISAIETLTRTWEPKGKVGLQITHDIQEIELDYNLTMPEKATEHITSILDAHAVYSGLPSIRAMCTSTDVLSRLVWVAAGVPRDALSIFAQAMSKAGLSGGRRVSVSNVNVAASEIVTTKLRELQTDASADADQLQALLDRIRDYCVKEQGQNAFLVEIKSTEPLYQRVLKLIDLRLLHVISEGVSIGEAGRKYLGLILDYGFYVGIRAAKSVELFNKQTKRVTRAELRGLPVFSLESAEPVS